MTNGEAVETDENAKKDRNKKKYGGILPILYFLGGALTGPVILGTSSGNISFEGLGFKFGLDRDKADIASELREDPNAVPLQTIKELYGLYELDANLEEAIKNLDYEHSVAEAIRNMSKKLIGPFDTREIDVQVTFKDSHDNTEVLICQNNEIFDNHLALTILKEQGSEDTLFMIDLDKDETNNPYIHTNCSDNKSEYEYIAAPIKSLPDENQNVVQKDKIYYGKARILINTVVEL